MVTNLSKVLVAVATSILLVACGGSGGSGGGSDSSTGVLSLGITDGPVEVP